MTRLHRIRCLAVGALLGSAMACENTPIPGGDNGAVEVAVHAGDAQSGQVGQPLAIPLAVLVTSSAGTPVAGASIAWLVQSGGGGIAATSTSGSDGVATATYTAGSTSGPKIIVASIVGGPDSAVATFHATVAAGPPAVIHKTGGDGQAVAPGAMNQPLEVTVEDTFGNPVSGLTVTWTVTAGSATIAPPSGPTDSLGRARATLTATTASAITVTAAVAGIGSPATFSATASNIALVRSVPIPDNYAIHDQFIRDGLAFVCAWNTGLRIYDVGNGMSGGTPANPVLVSTIVTSANGIPGGAAVHNAWWFWNPVTNQKRYVFVGQEGPSSGLATSSGDIHVVDVSNLAAPVEVAFYHMGLVNGQNTGVHNFWMDEQKQILYAAYYNGGIVALDVSGTLTGDLASREIARIRPGGNGNTFIWGVQLFNGSLYATDMLSGFWQVALTPSGTFGAVSGGNNVPERFGSDQWVHGGYAYSGTWGTRSGRAGNTVKIWQLGAGGAPTLVDSIVTPTIGTVSDVEVTPDGKLLMFSAEGGSGRGIYFYTLADPAHPVFAGFYAVSTGVHTATFSTINGRLYAFAAKDPSNSALLILDVTALLP